MISVLIQEHLINEIKHLIMLVFPSTLQLKCHQYWPKDEGHSMLFGSLRVTMKRQTSLAFWKERIIHITHNEVGVRLVQTARRRLKSKE